MNNEPLKGIVFSKNELQKEKRLGIVHQENSRPIHRKEITLVEINTHTPSALRNY